VAFLLVTCCYALQLLRATTLAAASCSGSSAAACTAARHPCAPSAASALASWPPLQNEPDQMRWRSATFAHRQACHRQLAKQAAAP